MDVIVNQMRAGAANAPDLASLPPSEARILIDKSAARWSVPTEAITSETVTIPSKVGTCEALLITPRAGAGRCAILYVHGGGWVLGSVQSHLSLAANLAVVSGAPVLSVDYRRAPEHKFPVALDDCEAAFAWLTARRSGPAFLCGDSVGAALCLATARRALVRSGPPPLGILALYGVFSAFSPDQIDGVGGPHIVTDARMEWFRDQYERVSGVDRLDPEFSPLEGRLEGMPPLFIGAAEVDSFHQDSIRLAQKAIDAGVEVDFRLYRGMIHGFMQMSREVATARQAIADAARFVTGRLAAAEADTAHGGQA